MTPEERAKIAYTAAILKREAGIGEGHDIILAAIKGANALARKEALEECAMTCEKVIKDWVDNSNRNTAEPLLREAAANIRNLKEKK